MKSQIPSPLEDHEAVFPAGIVSLLVRKTVDGVMDGSTDISATYYAYFTKLVCFFHPRIDWGDLAVADCF